MIGSDFEELASWLARPEASHALLVGLDAYGDGVQPTPGLAAQAAGIARALIARGLPPHHVHLLTSGADIDVPEGVLTGGVTTSSLRDHVRQLVRAGGEFLWGHWAGHGYLKGDTHRLLLEDASDEMVLNISLADLTERFMCDLSPVRQYWTIDSCQTYYPGIIKPDRLHVGREAVEKVKQLILVSSRPGEASPYVNVGGISALGAAAITFLERAPNGVEAPWPPPPDAFEHGLPEIVKMSSSNTVRGRFIIRAPWAAYDHPDFGQRRSVIVRTPLTGWVMPGPWTPAALNPDCSSGSMTRLDLRLVMDRHPLSAVVADPAEADLADDLNAAEEELRQALPFSAARIPERRWATVEALEPPTAAGIDGVGEAAEPAFVIRIDVEPGAVANPGRISEAVDQWVRRIDDRFPAAPVVVAVRSRRAVDSVLMAGSLTEATPLRRRRNPDLSGWSMMARVRPGLVGADGYDAAGEVAGYGLSGLLSRLAAAARNRNILLPSVLEVSLAPPRDQESPGRAPAEVARQVVSDLENDDGLNDRFDEALLCAVRDFEPHLLQPLLEQYARRRRGPAWGVSLAVAAQFDQNLQIWLTAARGNGPGEKDQWPPARFGTRPADAVVLHFARRNDEDAGLRLIEEWRRLGVSPAVDAALSAFCTCRTVPPALSDLPIGTVAALARGGLYRSLRGDEADWKADATWVALANSATEGATLRDELTALSRADDPDLAFAALGLLPLPADAEPLVHERAAELRRILNRPAEEAPT